MADPFQDAQTQLVPELPGVQPALGDEQASSWARALDDYASLQSANAGCDVGSDAPGAASDGGTDTTAPDQPKPWPLTDVNPDQSWGQSDSSGEDSDPRSIDDPGVTTSDQSVSAAADTDQAGQAPPDWPALDPAGPNATDDALAPIRAEIGRALSRGDITSAQQFADCLTPTASARPSAARLANLSRFAAQYMRLNPVDFSKGVSSFAYDLESRAHYGLPIDHVSARDQYDWLQNRLMFLQSQPNLTPRQLDNLHGAALDLYRGAHNAGVVDVDRMEGLPQSYIAAAAGAMLADGSNMAVAMRRAGSGALQPDYIAPVITRAPRPSAIGDHLDNGDVKIGWGRGLKAQGDPWEDYTEENYPAARTPPGFPRWDNHVPREKMVISNKTLDTSQPGYIKDPRQIFNTAAKYIDQASSYNKSITRSGTTIDPKNIATRQIQLAVPQSASPQQLAQINRAIIYGRSKGVSVVVTAIRGGGQNPITN